MGHEDEDIIILSISLPSEGGPPLDKMVANGVYGSTREEVARHLICGRLRIKAGPRLPQQAATVVVEATGGDTPDGPPDPVPPGGPEPTQ